MPSHRHGLSRLMTILIMLTFGVIGIVVAASILGVIEVRAEDLITLFEPSNIIPGFEESGG